MDHSVLNVNSEKRVNAFNGNDSKLIGLTKDGYDMRLSVSMA